jgi:hypothetical protein
MIKNATVCFALLSALMPAATPAVPSIPVCMDAAANRLPVFQAEAIASKIFSPAGFTVNWRFAPKCLPNSIRVIVQTGTRGDDHPGAYGYSRPFEGTNAVVFFDRILEAAPNRAPVLLAYVLAHEITHLIERTTAHEPEGVMKPGFNPLDLSAMIRGTLALSPADVHLLQTGIASRNEPATTAVDLIARAKPEDNNECAGSGGQSISPTSVQCNPAEDLTGSETYSTPGVTGRLLALRMASLDARLRARHTRESWQYRERGFPGFQSSFSWRSSVEPSTADEK